MRYLIFITCCGIVFLLTTISAASEFQYRDKYPEVNIIELNDLKTGYDNEDCIIVDVRSKIEFDTIHIKKSLNIPYGHAYFTRDLQKVSQDAPGKKIIIYDNGIDSVKSYQATEDALHEASIVNVYAFDAGITVWAETYPDATILQGAQLKNPKEQLLSEDKFSNKSLDFNTFSKKASSNEAIVIDLRDPLQRKEKLPGFENALKIPVDKLVRNIIKKGYMKDKELFIFDQVGKRVQWVMYYLVDNDYTDFYFLDGGATSVLEKPDYRVSFNHQKLPVSF